MALLHRESSYRQAGSRFPTEHQQVSCLPRTEGAAGIDSAGISPWRGSHFPREREQLPQQPLSQVSSLLAQCGNLSGGAENQA